MKRRRMVFIIVFALLLISSNYVLANEGLYIYILKNYMTIGYNGEELQLDNFLYDNKIYVPLTDICKVFNKELMYNETDINIVDKEDLLDTVMVTNVEDDILTLEFQLRNNSKDDLIVTLQYPYYDFIIYDEDGEEVYRHTEQYSVYATVIRDEKIPAGKKFIIDREISLKDLELDSDKTYEVKFCIWLEKKEEKEKLSLSQKAYFIAPKTWH